MMPDRKDEYREGANQALLSRKRRRLGQAKGRVVGGLGASNSGCAGLASG